MAQHNSGRFSSRHNFHAGMIGLHVDSVRKQFGNRQVLNDVFLSCKPGQIVGLLGRNGSGKSTLMKIIFGTTRADNKFVSVDGVVINSLYQGHRLIRYLPHDGFLPGHIIVKDVITCMCRREWSATLMQHDFIKAFLQQKPGQLSGGERRVIEILIMLHSGAKYFLFDEPFSGLSPLYIEVIKTIIRSNLDDKGFVITDHNYEAVIDLSSNMILLDRGNTKAIMNYGDLVTLGYLPSKNMEILKA